MSQTHPLTKSEEKLIRQILADLARQNGLIAEEKETYEKKKSFYIDHLWKVKIGDELIPIVAFEIEKGIPSNERIRKDIFNLVYSKAPIGYVIVPDSRIRAAPLDKVGWVKWYKNNFFNVFANYYEPFRSHIDIRMVDADVILQRKTLKERLIWR